MVVPAFLFAMEEPRERGLKLYRIVLTDLIDQGCLGVPFCYDQAIMELRPNIPLDTQAIAQLIDDPADMHLVWPKARWPFDHGQWHRALDPASGHHPFLIYEQHRIIGQVAIRTTSKKSIYSVNYLYLQPPSRSQGVGRAVMAVLEKYATERLKALQLNLVVRTYNPRALACYQKCGFKTDYREGSLIHMLKILP